MAKARAASVRKIRAIMELALQDAEFGSALRTDPIAALRSEAFDLTAEEKLAVLDFVRDDASSVYSKPWPRYPDMLADIREQWQKQQSK